MNGTGPHRPQPRPPNGAPYRPSRTPARSRPASGLSLAQQVFLLQLSVIVLLVVAGSAVGYLNTRRAVERDAEREVLTLATALARLPAVGPALAEPDPATVLQPIAESVRQATRVDFVVFMAPDRTRYSHPDPAQIGQRFLGTVEPALAGGTVTETYTGTLGPSIRAVVPITDPDGSVRALVSVGILRSKVGDELRQRLPPLIAAVLLALVVAAGGSLAVSRRLRRQTLGLGPAEITRMYEHHDAVLHAVREGLLVTDQSGNLVLVNDEARRLLGLPADAEGRPVAELGLTGELADLLASGAPANDQLHVHADLVLVVNQTPARRDGRRLGTVTTLRDHTELQALNGELDSVRGFAEALRAHAHEAANRLHTVVTMIELGRPDQAVEFATADLATTQALADRLVGAVDEPVLAALLLGKAAQAHERGIDLVIDPETTVRRTRIAPRDLVTLLGNLIDNGLDAAQAAPPPRQVTVGMFGDGHQLRIRVTDSGRGLAADDVELAFDRGWSTKAATGGIGRGIGLALVRQVIDRYNGSVTVDTATTTTFTVLLQEPVS